MLTFKKFIKEQTLIEGGNAVKGVGPINQENSMATYEKCLKEYLPKFGLKKNQAVSLGSTGKKAPLATSGDIDIALSAPDLLKSNKINTFEDIIDKIVSVCKSLGHDYRDMRGIGIVSIAYPIVNVDGLQEGEKVQVDFMVVESVKLASWMYYSPSYLESDLKGLYRNEANIAVAKHAGFKVTEFDKETKEPISWERFWFSLTKGLVKGKATRKSAKTGNVVKQARSFDKETVYDDADDIVRFLYGDKYTSKNILTFDDALNAILSSGFPHKKNKRKILKMIAKGIQDKGYPIPESLDKYV